MLYRPREVATQLAVSGPTLRLWSSYFAEELSPEARKSAPEGGMTAQRRYTDEDIATLQEVRTLLRSGLTFEEARRRLLVSRGKPVTEPARPVTAHSPAPGPAAPAPTAPTAPPVYATSPVHVPVYEGVMAATRDRALEQPTETMLEQLRAKERTIAALEEALAARDAAYRALQDTIAAKDKTIDALKDSLQFFNAYLQAIGGMQAGQQPAPQGGLQGTQSAPQPGVQPGTQPGAPQGPLSTRMWISPEEGEEERELDQESLLEKPLWRRLLGIQ